MEINEHCIKPELVGHSFEFSGVQKTIHICLSLLRDVQTQLRAVDQSPIFSNLSKRLDDLIFHFSVTESSVSKNSVEMPKLFDIKEEIDEFDTIEIDLFSESSEESKKSTKIDESDLFSNNDDHEYSDVASSDDSDCLFSSSSSSSGSAKLSGPIAPVKLTLKQQKKINNVQSNVISKIKKGEPPLLVDPFDGLLSSPSGSALSSQTLGLDPPPLCPALRNYLDVPLSPNASDPRLLRTANPPWRTCMRQALSAKFGFQDFRPAQQVAMDLIVAGEDQTIILPTGGGKSLLYSLPPLVLPGAANCLGVSLVISPLVSLMQDQVLALQSKNIPSLALFSDATSDSTVLEVLFQAPPTFEPWNSANHREKNLNNVNSIPRVVFMTPEKVLTPFGQRLIEVLTPRLVLVAFDEAHCIWQWGQTFRKDYVTAAVQVRQIVESTLNRVKHSNPISTCQQFAAPFASRAMFSIPFIGLTATASPEILSKIENLLSIKSSFALLPPLQVRASTFRPNLHLRVVERPSDPVIALQELAQVIHLISSHASTTLQNHRQPAPTHRKSTAPPPSGLVYCLSQKDTTTVAKALESMGIQALPYHASLPIHYRQNVQESWRRGEIQVVVATVAFGLGIDKSNCRFVIHMAMPQSMDRLAQEWGRAGRDGKTSLCLLMYNACDLSRVRSLIYLTSKQAGQAYKEKALKQVQEVFNFCMQVSEDNGSSYLCRHVVLAKAFAETNFPVSNCMTACDICTRVANKSMDISMPLLRLSNACVRQKTQERSKSSMAALRTSLHASPVSGPCIDVRSEALAAILIAQAAPFKFPMTTFLQVLLSKDGDAANPGKSRDNAPLGGNMAIKRPAVFGSSQAVSASKRSKTSANSSKERRTKTRFSSAVFSLLEPISNECPVGIMHRRAWSQLSVKVFLSFLEEEKLLVTRVGKPKARGKARRFTQAVAYYGAASDAQVRIMQASCINLPIELFARASAPYPKRYVPADGSAPPHRQRQNVAPALANPPANPPAITAPQRTAPPLPAVRALPPSFSSRKEVKPVIRISPCSSLNNANDVKDDFHKTCDQTPLVTSTPSAPMQFNPNSTLNFNATAGMAQMASNPIGHPSHLSLAKFLPRPKRAGDTIVNSSTPANLTAKVKHELPNTENITISNHTIQPSDNNIINNTFRNQELMFNKKQQQDEEDSAFEFDFDDNHPSLFGNTINKNITSHKFDEKNKSNQSNAQASSQNDTVIPLVADEKQISAARTTSSSLLNAEFDETLREVCGYNEDLVDSITRKENFGFVHNEQIKNKSNNNERSKEDAHKIITSLGSTKLEPLNELVVKNNKLFSLFKPIANISSEQSTKPNRKKKDDDVVDLSD